MLPPNCFLAILLRTRSIDHSYAFVIGHTWTISNTKVNQFNYGETRGVFGFPNMFNPPGTTQYASFMPSPSGISQLGRPHFMARHSQHRSVPIPVFRDDFNYVRGKHNIQIGGTFKPIKDSSTLVGDFNLGNDRPGNPVNSLTGPRRCSTIPLPAPIGAMHTLSR